MNRKDLKNKPLVEAMVEARWVLVPDKTTSGAVVDPHYRLLLGRFSERVQKDYPFYESLPAASIPDNMVPYVIQHRFRAKEAGWPLLQMGPGIMAINDTSGYTWSDFQKRCVAAVSWLEAAHPSISEFKLQDVTLRYIDAIEFDYKSENIFQFLADKMKTTIALPASLFRDTKVSRTPSGFNWQSSFAYKEPDGTLTLRFVTGLTYDKPALIMETLVKSSGSQVLGIADFPKWLEGAHNITDDWFFKLIEGELERRFSGD